VILLTHSMSGAYGWRLRETHGRAIEAVVGVAPAPPGNIQAVPPVTRETEDHVELAGPGRLFAARQARAGPAVARLRREEADRRQPPFFRAP